MPVYVQEIPGGTCKKKKKKNHTTFIVIHKPINTYMS